MTRYNNIIIDAYDIGKRTESYQHTLGQENIFES